MIIQILTNDDYNLNNLNKNDNAWYWKMKKIMDTNEFLLDIDK